MALCDVQNILLCVENLYGIDFIWNPDKQFKS